MEKFINKHIYLEKLEGTNNTFIFIGSIEVNGILKEPIEIGKQIILYDYFNNKVSWTSVVVDINEEENIIKTKNSVYLIKTKI